MSFGGCVEEVFVDFLVDVLSKYFSVGCLLEC